MTRQLKHKWTIDRVTDLENLMLICENEDCKAATVMMYRDGSFRVEPYEIFGPCPVPPRPKENSV